MKITALDLMLGSAILMLLCIVFLAFLFTFGGGS